MSTPSPPRAVPGLLPALLLLSMVGVGLLVWTVFLAVYNSDEIFVAFLSGLGGLTMLVAVLAFFTAGRRGAR